MAVSRFSQKMAATINRNTWNTVIKSTNSQAGLFCLQKSLGLLSAVNYRSTSDANPNSTAKKKTAKTAISSLSAS